MKEKKGLKDKFVGNRRSLVFGFIGFVFGGIIVFGMMNIESVVAKKTKKKKSLELMNKELIRYVKMGDELFHSDKLGTNGLACANCHPDAANTNPHTFPKFQENVGEFATLRDMINWCIKVPLEGKPLPHDSEEMKAIEAYIYYMYRGKTLVPGDNIKAHPPVKVESGPGYP